MRCLCLTSLTQRVFEIPLPHGLCITLSFVLLLNSISLYGYAGLWMDALLCGVSYTLREMLIRKFPFLSLEVFGLGHKYHEQVASIRLQRSQITSRVLSRDPEILETRPDPQVLSEEGDTWAL